MAADLKQMKTFLNAIRRTAESDSSIDAVALVAIGNRVESFVIRITKQPVLGVEAPTSLWNQLQQYRDGPRHFATVVAKWTVGKPIIFPLLLGQESPVSENATGDLWPAHTRTKESLGSAELVWAARHLTLERSNTLFPTPFEHRVLNDNRDALLRFATDIDLLTHRTSTPRRIVAPKATTGTRVATQLDPLDALLLTALVSTCGPVVERGRVSTAEGVVHSFRFQPEEWGGLWASYVGYQSFEEAADARLESSDVAIVIEADIASFYHRISPRLVGRRLEQMGVHPRRAEAAGRVLESVGDGLPVGPSSSAFFAECVLAGIDDVLLAGGVSYTRFNDDFRLFCRHKSDADGQLSKLVDALAPFGLSLNGAKTRQYAKAEYKERRERTRDWWLRKAGNEIAANSDYQMLAEHTLALSESATSVLRKSLEKSEGRWLKLERAALRAIRPERKLEIIPQLLDEIANTWALSSDIAIALRVAAARGKIELEASVPRSFAVGASRVTDHNTLDFALVWILHALRECNWPGRETLAPLLMTVPQSSAARRELVAAVDGLVDPAALALPDVDGWTQRVRALIGTTVAPVAAARGASPADAFNRQLTAAIAASRVG